MPIKKNKGLKTSDDSFGNLAVARRAMAQQHSKMMSKLLTEACIVQANACEKCGITMRNINDTEIETVPRHVLCRPCLDKREKGA